VLVLALLSAGGACKKSEPETPPAPSAAESAPSGERALPADPGPVLSARTGPIEAQRLPDVTVQATGHEVVDGHVLIAATLPAAIAGEVPPYGPLRVFLPAGIRGAAAYQATESDVVVLVRVAADEAPATLEVTLGEPSEHWYPFMARHWDLRTVHIEGIAESPTASLGPRFWAALSRFFYRWDRAAWSGPRSAFAGFAAGRTARLGGVAEAMDIAVAQGGRRGGIAETMALYTGITSVEEALQTARGLRLQGAPGKRTIPIAELTAVPLAAHPWDAMMAKLGAQPVMEPLARVVPARTMYVHFRDLRVAVQLANDLSTWLQPAVEMLEGHTGTSHLVERYERQLIVERTALAEKLGHLAADGVAFIAGDPHFRDGADVAILFKVNNRALLTGALAGFEAAARERRDDLEETTYEVAGRAVRRLSTPDRAVDQHRLELDEVLVLANSRAIIESLVAVADERETSLAESGDFKTFRTMDPYSPSSGEEEDGYVFLSDDFVAHVISPATKVLASRRMLARMELMAVGNAALLYGWVEGRAAESVEALLEAGFLLPEELKHEDGSPIVLAGLDGPRSEAWGRIGAMKPLSELTVDMVTVEEKEAFDAFARTYQRYWRDNIDPVGIRITRSADGRTLAMDARMMPLIANTEYDHLVETVGVARVEAQALPSGIRWVLGVGDEAEVRRALDGLGRMVGRSDLAFGWLGEWVEVGALDRAGLWDALLLSGSLPQIATDDGWHVDRTYEALSRLPVWVGAHVRNQLSLAATLTAIRAEIASVAPDLVRFDDGGKYRGVSIVTIRPTRFTATQWGSDKLALHYATPNDRIVLSLDRVTLEAAIDVALDGKGPKVPDPKSTEGTQALLTLGSTSAESWFTKALLGLMEAEARDAFRGAFRDAEALYRGLPATAPGSAEWDRAALAYFGSIPTSAHGGTFSVGPEGLLTHSIYGSEVAPAFPVVPVEESPVTAFFRSLESASFGIAFEGEGDFRALRVKATWTRR